MSKERFVVIGGDAAGMSAASRARRNRPDLEIEVFEMGRFVSYGACGIPYFISGEVATIEDLVQISAAEFQTKRGIKMNLGHRVEEIRPEKKICVVADLDAGKVREAPYDHLLIAAGAKPILPANLDVTLPGVFAIRGLQAAGELKQYILTRSPKTAVIIGGGYIGLEMAEALSVVGMKVTLVEFLPRVIPAMAEEISERVSKTLAEHGVNVLTGVGAKSLARDGGRLQVVLESGAELSADLIVVAIGVSPRSELAAAAELTLGVKGAIQVDRRQRTSNPSIFAGGDCSEAFHLLLGRNVYIPLGLTANRQGRIVGDNVTGVASEFPGLLGTALSRTFDLALARTGLNEAEGKSLGLELKKVVLESRTRAFYYPGGDPMTMVLFVEKPRQKLWGAQLAGRDGVAQRIDIFAVALAAGFTLSQIYDLDLAYAPPYSPVWDPVLLASEVAMKK